MNCELACMRVACFEKGLLLKDKGRERERERNRRGEKLAATD